MSGAAQAFPTARQLVAAGCEVIGIDISPVMLDLVRRNVPEATYLQRDAVDLDTGLGQFDAVVAFFSLLMMSRREIVTTLENIGGLLTPAGWLAMGMVEADLDDVELPFLGLPLRVTGWPREQLRMVVEAAGFEVQAEDVRVYDPPSPDVPPEIQVFLIAKRT